MAGHLGRPMIPWQRDLVDVAGELDPAGRFAHRYVVVIVPRRAGKTLAMLAYALAVTYRRRAGRAFYASHRRATAGAIWADDWIPWLEDSALAPRHVKVIRSNGNESMTWRHNRSTIRLQPPSGDAMRAFAADVVLVDEARQFTADQGADIEAAAFPTQTTGLGGQAWIVSNAGTADSVWLAKWRDLGRESVGNPDSRIAYLEYAAPEGADPDDPETLRLAHPGVGHHVIEDAIRADRETMNPDDWACEYLGWWPEALVDSVLVDAWNAASSPAVDVGPGPVFALEIDEPRDVASIVAVGTGPDGRLAIELVDHRPHGRWVAARVVELVDRWGPAAVAYDSGAPAGALAHDLADVATNVAALNVREVAAACGWLHDQILAGAVVHNGDALLAAAIRAARRRRVGGSWVFDRRQPGSGPLIAAALAGWTHRDAHNRAPSVA